MPDTGEDARLLVELDVLVQAISAAARGLPGAVAFHMFGSQVEGHSDAWSDLDIQIVVTDVESARDCLFSTLTKTRPIEFAWIIDSGPEHWAASLVFRETSLFHKVDLGILSPKALDQRPMPQHSMLLWSQAELRSVPCWELAAPPYMPGRDSDQHVVLGHLLSVTRYVKARKRGHLATCWRFASSLADAVFAAYFHRAGTGESVPGRLETREYQALDRHMSRSVLTDLMSLLDFSSPPAMDRTVYLLMHQLVEAYGECLDSENISPILEGFYGFARRELELP